MGAWVPVSACRCAGVDEGGSVEVRVGACPVSGSRKETKAG